MSELRAPDLTLTASAVSEVYLFPYDGEPLTAHVDGGCGLANASHWMEEPRHARWFAVPCRDCFPYAPPPGHREWLFAGSVSTVGPDPDLAWQVQP